VNILPEQSVGLEQVGVKKW